MYIRQIVAAANRASELRGDGASGNSAEPGLSSHTNIGQKTAHVECVIVPSSMLLTLVIEPGSRSLVMTIRNQASLHRQESQPASRLDHTIIAQQ